MFPRISSLRKKGPARKLSARYTTKPPSNIPEFEMLEPSGKSNGFVIQITEGRPSISEAAPSPSHIQDATQPSPRRKPQPPLLTIPPKAHIAEEPKPNTPPSPPMLNIAEESAPSPANVPLPRSNAPTPEIMQHGGVPSPKSETPVMRSMFPRYDPSRPLARQSYYPHLDSVPGLASAMAVAGSSLDSRNSNNPYRQQMAVNKNLDIGKTSFDSQRPRTAEVKESPLKSVENSEQQANFSTPEDLVEVWNIANGQAPSDEAADIYSLELSW